MLWLVVFTVGLAGKKEGKKETRRNNKFVRKEMRRHVLSPIGEGGHKYNSKTVRSSGELTLSNPAMFLFSAKNSAGDSAQKPNNHSK